MSNSMPMKLSGSSALVTLLQRQNIRTLFCSTPRFEKKKEPSKKYSSTLLLPKTSFPMKVEGKKRIARDKEISEKCKFDSQYSRQRQNRYIWLILKRRVRTIIFSGLVLNIFFMMALPMPMGRHILVMQWTRFSKTSQAGELETRNPKNMFLIQYSSQGFTALVVNGSTGCQVYIKGSD